MNTGLLILRLVTGLLFVGHGIQKVSHRLGGHGIEGGAAEFRADGFRGGRLTAAAAGLGQITAGLLLAAGALTPLAAVTAGGVMTVAATVKWRNGLWVQHDGYEYPLVLIVLPAVLTLTGPGRWSVDRAAGLLPWAPWWAAAAVGLGVSSGLMTRALLARPVPDH
ncbi:DoxX family protein [Streptomyces sp. NPDC020800]|uniref:DoxX family protein n=1 Tax=Streptomyces sp. NPDC020800 TaxID=3365092 RepID=UPI0037BCC1B6